MGELPPRAGSIAQQIRSQLSAELRALPQLAIFSRLIGALADGDLSGVELCVALQDATLAPLRQAMAGYWLRVAEVAIGFSVDGAPLVCPTSEAPPGIPLLTIEPPPVEIRSVDQVVRYVAALAQRFVVDPLPYSGESVGYTARLQARHGQVVLAAPRGPLAAASLRYLLGYYGLPWLTGRADQSTPIPIYGWLSAWPDRNLDLVGFLQSQLRDLGQCALAEGLPALLSAGRAVLLLEGLDELPCLDPAGDPRVSAIDAWPGGCVVSCTPQALAAGLERYRLVFLSQDAEPAAPSESPSQVLNDGRRTTEDQIDAAQPLLYPPTDFQGAAPEPGEGLDSDIDQLILALSDEEDAVRHRAAQSLGAAAALRALPHLLWMARHDQGQYVGESRPRHVAAQANTRICQVWNEPGSLIELLGSSDARERYGAAFRLAGMGYAEAMPVLLEALGDEDARIRWGALYWLGQLRDPRAIDGLITALADHEPRLERSLIDTVRSYGVAAAPLLVEVLQHPDALTRARAATILGAVGRPEEMEPLLAGLDDPEGDVRDAVAGGLGRIAARHPEGVTPGLVNALVAAFQSDRADLHNRIVIAESVAQLDKDRAVTLWIDTLHHPAAELRREAAARLGQLGDRRAVVVLNLALSDSESGVREQAAESLRGFRDYRSLKALTSCLGDEDSYVRLAAIAALTAIGDSRAGPALVNMLHDDSARIRMAASEALLQLADEPTIARLIMQLGVALPASWSFVYRPPDEPPALTVLVQLGGRGVRPLITALGDGNGSERGRYWCRQALAQIGPPAIDPLIEALESGLPELRAAAAEVLGAIGDARALEPLVRSVSDASVYQEGSTVGSVAAAAVQRIIRRNGA